MRLVILTTLLASICLPNWENSATAQGIQTYERRFIGDIGYAEVDRQGNAVVVMNPAACRRLGPNLCNFFKAHEMAHHQLGHFDRNITVQQKEAEADLYAASVVSPASRSAAQQFFASGRGGSSRHGSSQQRLARVSGLGQAGSQATVSSQVVKSSQTDASNQVPAGAQVTASSQVAAGTIATKGVTRSSSSERLGATRSVPSKWIRIIRVPSCR